MSLKLDKTKEDGACHIHGAPAKSGNRMLFSMIVASFLLIAWHVKVYGPSIHVNVSESGTASFSFLLGSELWDLFFSNKGIVAELKEVLPYFLVGVFIAGYLRTYKVAVKLQATFRKYGVASVFIASFVGIITPLCACGTLTTAISLLFAGIPLAPVMALMVTSPLLSPSTYLLTLNDLGPEWTVIRTLSALSFGIFAGLITHMLSMRGGFRKQDIFIEGAIIRGDFHDDDYPDERLRCNCRRNFGNQVALRTGNMFLVFLAKSSEMLWVVGKYVLVGVTIGAVVERYLPSEWIYRFFSQKDPFNIVWVTLASVPMFIHQISASSIISHLKGSLDGTLDSGAALAFMIGGPVTAVPTMVLFWTFFKKRVFVLYMLLSVFGTLLIAYTFQFLVFMPGVDLGNPLLKGVKTLTGGASCSLRKESPNVRMVMDPTGKGLIATYTNIADAGGPIVFDGSFGRFTKKSSERYDNRKYIENIAVWLAENANTPARKNILVYNLSGAPSDNGSYQLLGDGLLANLRENGFTVKVTNRMDLIQLSDKVLNEFGQLWLFFAPHGSDIPLTETEIKLISKYNTAGNGLLCVPPSISNADHDIQNVNHLTSRFGAQFSGTYDYGDVLKVSSATIISFEHAAEMLGKLLKLVKKA